MANRGACRRTCSARAVSSRISANARARSGLIRAAASIATLAFACANIPALAGTNTWTTNGPYGGLVTVLAVDPQTPANLYAAGISGVFKSSNGGATWARASNGINSPSVDAIAIDPVTPSTLYAGAIQGVVTKSVDGGATWNELLGVGAPSLVVALAIDPKTQSTIYASTSQGGISKSIDSGATWAGVGFATLPSFPTFNSLVIDPVTPSTIYAGDNSNGVYKSVDGGATWNPSNTGLTGPALQIRQLAIDPQTPATLYAVANTSGGSGLFKSTDGGGHWTLIANGNVAAYNFLILTVAVDPQTPSIVYIGALNGTSKSTNGGTSFAPIHSGMPTRFVEVIAINPKNSATLYAGTIDGIFATANGGALWAAANNGLELTTVTAVAVDPSTPTTIYAGTSVSGLFKSTDGASSWASTNTGIGSTGNECLVPNYTALAIDPVTTTTLYAATTCTEFSGVLKSIDGGAHWTVAATGLPEFGTITALAIDPQATSIVYAGSMTSGMFQSIDGGGSWSAANGGVLDGAFITGLSITVLPAGAAISPPPGREMDAEPGRNASGTPRPNSRTSVIVIASDGSGINFSTDGGRTIIPVDPDDVRCINKLTTIFASHGIGISNIRIFLACVSPDVGDGREILGWYESLLIGDVHRPSVSTKGPVASGLPPVSKPWGEPDGTSAEAIACSPASSFVGDPLDPTGASFYAGAACGVLHAINYGQQIVTMNAGLPTKLQINAMDITPAGDTLYGGATSGGVYRYTLAAQSPTQLAFASIDTGSPTAGVAFDVVVEAAAADLSAQNVASDTTVQLSLHSGIGALGGTLSCQIPAGSSTCTVTGATYSVADSNVVLTATRTVGDALTPSNSPAFSVGAAEAPTQLAITSINGGEDPIVGVAFNVLVAAQADDFSSQNVAAATTVQLSVSTGAGTLGGTTTCQIPAGSSSCTVVGVTYSQADTNVVLVATRTAGDALAPGNSGAFNVDLLSSPPSLVSAVSRRVHGSAGTFDLPLSLVVPPAINHSPTTEPRQGPAQTIVFTFDKAISGATATVTEGTATPGTPTFSGNSVIVPLTGVTNKQYVTVTLSAVSSTDGGSGGAGVARVGFLLADVNGNRVVTVSDILLVNQQIAHVVTSANFLRDVNANGILTVSDKLIINSNVTKALPAP